MGPDLIDLGFAGTPSPIGGLSVEALAQETVWIHQKAFPELTLEALQDLGFVRYRRAGEYHLNNPEARRRRSARPAWSTASTCTRATASCSPSGRRRRSATCCGCVPG